MARIRDPAVALALQCIHIYRNSGYFEAEQLFDEFDSREWGDYVVEYLAPEVRYEDAVLYMEDEMGFSYMEGLLDEDRRKIENLLDDIKSAFIDYYAENATPDTYELETEAWEEYVKLVTLQDGDDEGVDDDEFAMYYNEFYGDRLEELKKEEAEEYWNEQAYGNPYDFYEYFAHLDYDSDVEKLKRICEHANGALIYAADEAAEQLMDE